jgi:hypothetical protein
VKYFVRLVRGKGLISRIIEFKESDWPSHAEIVETDDADNPIRVLSSRYPGGVAIRGYNDYPVLRDEWFQHRDPQACQLAWVTLETIIGRQYDLLDIFGIGFATDWHADGRYICSEAVAWAFERCGYPIFNPDEAVRRIMPSHFLLARDLQFYNVRK